LGEKGAKESPSRCASELVISQLGLAGATCSAKKEKLKE